MQENDENTSTELKNDSEFQAFIKEVERGIDQGLKEVEQGLGIPMEEAFKIFEQKHGISENISIVKKCVSSNKKFKRKINLPEKVLLKEMEEKYDIQK